MDKLREIIATYDWERESHIPHARERFIASIRRLQYDNDRAVKKIYARFREVYDSANGKISTLCEAAGLAFALTMLTGKQIPALNKEMNHVSKN